MNNEAIRKQLYDLTPLDLGTAAVWEFALDEEDVEGQDEATVRPWHVEGPLDPSDGMFVVRAKFVLADGTAFAGYITPPEDGEGSLGALQPVIVTDSGQVGFWYGALRPTPTDLAASYARLGKGSGSEVFPVRFESEVPLTLGGVHGHVPGFLVLEDFETGRAAVVV